MPGRSQLALLTYPLLTTSFFVNLAQIPPVLRWLRWFSTLGYTLEALSVNEVGAGLMIKVSYRIRLLSELT